MKHIKKSIMKFINSLPGILLFFSFQVLIAQEDITENTLPVEPVQEVKDTIRIFEKIKIDGVAAVVGDHVILESDIDKSYLSLETQGVAIKDIPRCQLLGKLMEDKLYAHQAVQDSILVSEPEITSYVDRQLQFLVSQIGSIEKVVEFYKKDDEESLRAEL